MVCHYSLSAISAADAANLYRLLIMAGGVGDFSQTLAADGDEIMAE